jgi:hypothetical protein
MNDISLHISMVYVSFIITWAKLSVLDDSVRISNFCCHMSCLSCMMSPRISVVFNIRRNQRRVRIYIFFYSLEKHDMT